MQATLFIDVEDRFHRFYNSSKFNVALFSWSLDENTQRPVVVINSPW